MLTPADIKHRSLKTTMGGYNKKDTDEFLASILESFEELSSENAKLKEKLTSLSEGIQYYKNLEDNLQKALVLAEKTSEETKNFPSCFEGEVEKEGVVFQRRDFRQTSSVFSRLSLCCRGGCLFHIMELMSTSLVPAFSALLPHLPSNGQGKPISRT